MAQDTLSRQLTQQLVNDPRWLQHLRDNAGQTHTSFGRATPATQRVAEQILGRPIPAGYFVRATGVQKSDSPVKPVLLSLAAMGGLGALGAAGVFGGAAAGIPAASTIPALPGAVIPAATATPAVAATTPAAPGLLSRFWKGAQQVLPWLQGAGDLAGNLAEGRAEGRQQDALLTLQENQRRQQLFDIMSRNQLALGQQRGQRAQFELDAPSTRFAQGLRGNLAANLQDFQWPAHLAGGRIQPTQGLGGARPSAIGPGGRGLGQQLAQLASERLGKDTYDLAEIGPPPDFLNMPQSGVGDQLLNYGGTALNLLELFNANRKKKPTQSWDAYTEYQ